MRKGTHKAEKLPPSTGTATMDNPTSKFVDAREAQILEILLRICDACHEMDNKTEPWATIRRDIERLK